MAVPEVVAAKGRATSVAMSPKAAMTPAPQARNTSTALWGRTAPIAESGTLGRPEFATATAIHAASGAATGAGGRRTRVIVIAAGRRRVPAPTSASAWRTARRASGLRPVRPRSRLAWPTGRRALALRRVPAAILARRKRPARRASGLRPARLPSRRASRIVRRALALRRVLERARRAVATVGRAGRNRRMISHRASSVNVLRRLLRTARTQGKSA